LFRRPALFIFVSAGYNTGTGLMAYAPPSEDVSGLAELGTASLAEFPVGSIDTQDLLLRWLA